SLASAQTRRPCPAHPTRRGQAARDSAGPNRVAPESRRQRGADQASTGRPLLPDRAMNCRNGTIRGDQYIGGREWRFSGRAPLSRGVDIRGTARLATPVLVGRFTAMSVQELKESVLALPEK